MKKLLLLFISVAILTCSAMGLAGAVFADEPQETAATCADYYAPSTDNYGKASSWQALTLEARAEGGICVGFANASATDIRTNLMFIAYKLNGFHMSMENFTGQGFIFSLNSEDRASSEAKNRLTVVIYNMPATDTAAAYTEICVRKGAWGASNTAFIVTKRVDGAMPTAFEIKFTEVEENYVMNFNGTDVNISADAINEAITNKNNIYLQFHPWTHGSTAIKTFSFDLTAVHGGEAICVDDLNNEEYINLDGTVYAPTTKLINRYSTWESFVLTDNDNNGGVHVKFDGVTSSDIRTRTWIVYELDGFEIDFANFTGDGFLFSVNGKSNSDNYSASNAACKLRFALYNNEKTVSFKIHVGEYVTGNTEYAYEYEIPQKLPQNFGFRFSKADDGSGDYIVKFLGMDFVISATDIERAIGTDEDGSIDKIYPQISGFGSTFKNTEFDIVNMHGNEVVCARDLTEEQKVIIEGLKSDISACVDDVQITKAYLDSLDALIGRYNDLDVGLKAFITNYTAVGTARNTVLADDGYSDAIIIQEEIEDLGEVVISKTYLDNIMGIEVNYAELTENLKTFVTGYMDLIAKKEALLSDEKYLAAIGIIEDIDSIGEVTLESKTVIETIRSAYDALDDGQQSFVTNYDTLTTAENTLATLIENQKPAPENNKNKGCKGSISASIPIIAALSVFVGVFIIIKKQKNKTR